MNAQYEVRWETPSQDSSGSMPLGNGDLGVNLWVEGNGDVLFYIAKGDAFDEQLRLLKLGLVRLRLSPALDTGEGFEQVLHLKTGSIEIRCGQVFLRIWVDANRPVVRVEIASSQPVEMEAILEMWRTNRRTLDPEELHSAYGFSESGRLPVCEADMLLEDENDAIIWCHRNEYSRIPELLVQQSLDTYPDYRDPVLHRTFGGILCGPGLQRDDRRIHSTESGTFHCLSVHCHTEQTSTLEEWNESLQAVRLKNDATPLMETWLQHAAWWQEFWDRSFIRMGGDEAAFVVGRGYTLQRFIAACGGRGEYPIKFNGSLFTVDSEMKGKKIDADFRQWGGHYWHQNTRLAYWPMLQSGDWDMMRPFFRFYSRWLELAKWRTWHYHRHEGVFFPETMTIGGTYAGDNYGWNREGLKPGDMPSVHIRLHLCGGLETAAMMLDFFSYTHDEEFARTEMLPLTTEILRFYQQHYPRDERGMLHLEPSQALETWQDTVNPVPELAGLQFCVDALLALPCSLTTPDQRAEWEKFRDSIPPLPIIPLSERRERINALCQENGEEVSNEMSVPGVFPDEGQHVLMPAEQVRGGRTNWENPELYAIFPFRRIMLGSEELEAGRASYWTRHELSPLPEWLPARFGGIYTGWAQDDIHAALLGLPEEAGKAVTERFGLKHPGSRFDAFWGPNFDWVPDQDHGSVGLIALQFMLLQERDGKLLLFPAWPLNWDVHFCLRAAHGVTVEAELKSGKLVSLQVTPPEREKDVMLMHEREMTQE